MTRTIALLELIALGAMLALAVATASANGGTLAPSLCPIGKTCNPCPIRTPGIHSPEHCKPAGI